MKKDVNGAVLIKGGPKWKSLCGTTLSVAHRRTFSEVPFTDFMKDKI